MKNTYGIYFATLCCFACFDQIICDEKNKKENAKSDGIKSKSVPRDRSNRNTLKKNPRTYDAQSRKMLEEIEKRYGSAPTRKKNQKKKKEEAQNLLFSNNMRNPVSFVNKEMDSDEDENGNSDEELSDKETGEIREHRQTSGNKPRYDDEFLNMASLIPVDIFDDADEIRRQIKGKGKLIEEEDEERKMKYKTGKDARLVKEPERELTLEEKKENYFRLILNNAKNKAALPTDKRNEAKGMRKNTEGSKTLRITESSNLTPKMAKTSQKVWKNESISRPLELAVLPSTKNYSEREHRKKSESSNETSTSKAAYKPKQYEASSSINHGLTEFSQSISVNERGGAHVDTAVFRDKTIRRSSHPNQIKKKNIETSSPLYEPIGDSGDKTKIPTVVSDASNKIGQIGSSKNRNNIPTEKPSSSDTRGVPKLYGHHYEASVRPNGGTSTHQNASEHPSRSSRHQTQPRRFSTQPNTALAHNRGASMRYNVSILPRSNANHETTSDSNSHRVDKISDSIKDAGSKNKYLNDKDRNNPARIADGVELVRGNPTNLLGKSKVREPVFDTRSLLPEITLPGFSSSPRPLNPNAPIFHPNKQWKK